jgi:hypothetical protein
MLTQEHRTRLELMASDNEKWDLSVNDVDAIQAALGRIAELEANLKRLTISRRADEQGKASPSRDELEGLGQTIDRVDSLAHGLDLPMPPAFHVDQLKTILPEVVADLKKHFVLVAGENPWE